MCPESHKNDRWDNDSRENECNKTPSTSKFFSPTGVQIFLHIHITECKDVPIECNAYNFYKQY
jgi:hypothetical protein